MCEENAGRKRQRVQTRDTCYREIPRDLPVMLDVETSSNIANCSPRHIREMLQSGKLQGVKLGKVWRVNRDALLEMLGLVTA